MVSTDSNEYAKIAISLGAKVPFLRSNINSNDSASSWDAVREVLNNYKEKGKNFDVVVMGSSGTDYKKRTAHEHAKIRTKEYNDVMQHLGIKKHWIYQTYGVRGVEQMDKMFGNYIRDLKTDKYDYIFLPVPHDRHQDHNHITNHLFKRILRKNGYKKDLKIVFYEVWSLIPNPNVFIDISKVINKKTKILHLYKSAHIVFQYADITKGLNRYRGTQANLPLGFAEAFYIDSVYNYMKKNYRIKLDGK